MVQIADPELYNRIKERIKASVGRWPNAYASGLLVQEYKRAMAEQGLPAYLDKKPDPKVGLARWYHERWIDIQTGKPCGAVKTDTFYPTCRPSRRVTAKTPVTSAELTDSQKKHMIKEKQKSKTQTVHYEETKSVTKSK